MKTKQVFHDYRHLNGSFFSGFRLFLCNVAIERNWLLKTFRTKTLPHNILLTFSSKPFEKAKKISVKFKNNGLFLSGTVQISSFKEYLVSNKIITPETKHIYMSLEKLSDEASVVELYYRCDEI